MGRTGPGPAGALADTAPWVIEVGLETATRAWLGPEPARWEAEIVQTIAREIGCGRVSEDDARAALADWRWPERSPPLNIVAAGVGRLPPITGDSAWGHACAARPRPTWDPLGADIAQVRADEARAIERPLERVRSAARHTVWAAPAQVDASLEEARALWAAQAALAGDGTLGTPRLAPGPRRHHPEMRWEIDVESPEALVAAGIWQGVGLERAIEDYLERHATISFGVATTGREVRIEHGAPRDQGERPARARALAEIGALLA